VFLGVGVLVPNNPNHKQKITKKKKHRFASF